MQDRDSSTLVDIWLSDKFKSSEPAADGNGREKISEKEVFKFKNYFLKDWVKNVESCAEIYLRISLNLMDLKVGAWLDVKLFKSVNTFDKRKCDYFFGAPTFHRTTFVLATTSSSNNILSCKIFEHFALQVDLVIEFIQLRSTPFKRQCHFSAKTSQSTFLVEKQLHSL